MAEFKLNRIRFTWKSDWATATVYTKDDIVRYSGKSYVCLVGHTSSADFNTDLEFINTAPQPDLADPKWVLWFDGYEWKGDWQRNTFYDLGDYVRYNGIVYICNDSHPSASTVALGLEIDQGKWTAYAISENWTTDWTTSRRYKLNDLVRYSGRIYKCINGHTAAATSALGLEADSGNWTLLSYGYEWKTDWAVSTRYKIGDIVRYGGIVYTCTLNHTSAATLATGIDPDVSKWSVLHNGIEYKTYWTASTRYKLNDIVKYGADLYICVTSHTSGIGFDTNDFSVWLPGLEFVNAWDATVYYIKGDIVTYGGYQYTSNTTNNIANIPSTSTANWTLLVKNYNICNEWNAGVAYRTGDLVRRGGYLYVAIADSINQNTLNNATFWEIVIPSMKWMNRWVISTTFTIGDVVTYYSTAYICTNTHLSALPPTTDTGNWDIYVRGEQFETLQSQGDIQSFDQGVPAAIPIGVDGALLKAKISSSTSLSVPAWDSWGIIGKVYYVSPTGTDRPDYGLTVQTAWKTVKYACEQGGPPIIPGGPNGPLVGPATINIKTGTYNETLPIKIPAGVALVGDELRGTVIQPAVIINCIATASSSSTNRITVNTTVGITPNINIQIVTPTIITTATSTSAAGNKITLGFTIGAYINMPVVFTGPSSFGNIVAGTTYYIQSYDSVTATITVSAAYGSSIIVTQIDAAGAMTATLGGFAGLDSGRTYYVIGSSITPTTFQVSFTSNGTLPLTLTDTVDQSAAIYGGDAIKDMFYVRNACGIRNMTLTGLLGGLGPANSYGSKRPTGGAYTSLDPGTGPNDASVHIITKSPYTQNVTLFGKGCVGLKIDGTLHNGGNRSIVANDYTTLISEGIGVWCTGPSSLTELVSVFAYYSHCGYLAENGGRIRATNGNTSYGDYGCVAEGFDLTEVPITGTVNNRNQHAQIASAFIGEATNKLLKLEFSNAGQNYTGASFAFTGAGTGASVIADEFRDNGIFESRILGSDFTAGGSGYLTSGNQAQAGDTQTITIASNDQNTFDEYYGMRVIITSGTGVGQYGYIAYYDAVGKIVTVAKEGTTALTSSATSATNNIISVQDATSFPIGTAVVMVPNQQNTTGFLTSRTVVNISAGYIIGTTLYVVSVTSGAIAVGMVLSGSTILGNTRIEANISGFSANSTWRVSIGQTVGTVLAPVAITGVNNLVSLTSTANMYVGELIVFSGSTFGNIVSGTQYYINNIIGSTVAISATSGGSVFTLANAAGSMSVVAGGMLGGLTAGQLYYVIAANYSLIGFAVSTVPGGTAATVTTQTVGSFITVHAVGWENIVAGTAAVAPLDSTTVYSIEPSIRFVEPPYQAQLKGMPIGNWKSVAFGNGRFVGISTAGTSVYSLTGSDWTAGGNLPAGTWTRLAFGGVNNIFVAVNSVSSTVAWSTDAILWNTSTSLSSGGFNALAFGNGRFIGIAPGSTNSAGTSFDGATWANLPSSLPVTATWNSIAYGSIGTWVAIAGASNNVVAYSTDNGSTWAQSTLPASINWISVAWGNGRFVAIASGSAISAYSFDGVTWIQSTLPVATLWSDIHYGQGLFFAVASGTTACTTSSDGALWKSRSLPSGLAWSSIVFGNPTVSSVVTPGWVALATSNSGSSVLINAGARALGRVTVASSKISSIKIWEPGSGYSLISAPTATITDPNYTLQVVTLCRTAAGVLGNPTFLSRGTGYRTSTTVVTVVNGTGFADIFQTSKFLTLSGLASLPTPGAALTVSGDATQYRVVVINNLGSSPAGYTVNFQIAPPLSILVAPAHNTAISIRQKYSQCRITGHDFLLIGTGNQTITNYPNVDVTTALSYQQIVENNGGRVFQTSTDQDGNFKVGNLFQVEQASGIVTISADQLSLTGLQTLSLGGFSIGTNAIVITQFSTDSFFTANSDSIVPTQKAIKTYLSRNIAGGGANAQAGAVVAGTFGVGGPNRIYSTVQGQLFVRNSMNLKKGINGTMVAKSFFHSGFGSGNQK
jgi:hypothetical protein